jgi:anti-sigma factor RsiW
VSEPTDAPADEHARFEAQFSDYVDGELAPAERSALEAHLAGCARCQGELEALRRTITAMRGGAAPTPSPEFMDSLREQIRTRSRGRFFGGKRPTYRLEVASLITLIIALVIYLALRAAQPFLIAP